MILLVLLFVEIVLSASQNPINDVLECACINSQNQRTNLQVTTRTDYCHPSPADFRPIDCKDVLEKGHRKNGVYTIFPSGNVLGYDVYCDMNTDGGGWTVFQRRLNGSVDFFRTWTEYMNGFGKADGEYWLGNEKLHELTSQHQQTLRIDMKDKAGIWKYASYGNFSISSNSTHYNLTAGDYIGNAGDSLRGAIGQTFKTKDLESSDKCASRYHGAWWYHKCHSANLNGLYDNDNYGQGLNWYAWHGYKYSLKNTEMKIRRA